MRRWCVAPADEACEEKFPVVRDALLAIEAAPHAWSDPVAALISHPLQAVDLEQARQTAPPRSRLRARVCVWILAGRSGTSCLAGMFGSATHHHAANLYQPQASNPKGYFESWEINSLNESIQLLSAVEHLGANATRDAPGLRARPAVAGAIPGRDAGALERRPPARSRRPESTPFCLKDPRASVTAPAWLEQAPDALVLSIHRPAPITKAESILRECRTSTCCTSASA